MKLSIIVQHGKKKKAMEIETTALVATLMEQVWQEFAIPVGGQKLVYKGKTMGGEMTLSTFNLITDSKIMIMGTPLTADEEKKAINESTRTLIKLKEDEQKGVNPKLLAEQCQKCIEALDGVRVPPSFTELKIQKKDLIVSYQSFQESLDKK
eukprot:TRINITY_DN31124_c0_g1_i1.p1 TRINITY_DN31124_c0_g1~~TRINITY_DN31124_c0_g1_i1.p1  ORF type:complete len:175 (+),score=52.09 TRINITY_DN31124_c0_g1_i1:71-526(+)